MNAKNYAQALKQALYKEDDFEKIWQNFLMVLKKRGVLKLLPKILAVLEKDLNQKSERKLLTIATEKDRENIIIKNNIAPEVQVKVDNSILGGYRLESPGELLDASYKTKLLELYRAIIKK